MAVLDSTAFPHILDRIIELAPPSALVNLRNTCLAARNKAEPLLFRHIIIDFNAAEDSFVLRSPQEPAVILPTLDTYQYVRTGRYKARVQLTRLDYPLRHTRITDYYGGHYFTFNLPQAHILRRPSVALHYRPPRFDTHVDYLDLDNPAAHAWVNVPPTRRWVAHVMFSKIRQAREGRLEIRTCGKPFDMVALFDYDNKEDGDEGEDEDEDEDGDEDEDEDGDEDEDEDSDSDDGWGRKELDDPHDIGILGALFGGANGALQHGTVTFVGVENLPPLALNMSPNTTPDEMIRRARDFFNLFFSMDMSPDEAEKLLEKMSFVTREEWLATLSDDERVMNDIPACIHADEGGE